MCRREVLGAIPLKILLKKYCKNVKGHNATSVGVCPPPFPLERHGTPGLTIFPAETRGKVVSIARDMNLEMRREKSLWFDI